MVSSSHEAMHRIFQEDPGIFARTFTALGLPFPEPVAVSLLPTDLTEIQPTFAELTELGLGTAPAADLWRDLMTVDLDFFRSHTSQRISEAGREEGQVHGIAHSVLLVLDKRDVDLSEEARQRVLGCTDQELLDRWLGRAVTVTDEAELFEEDPVGA